jgi:HEAT repeat protein
MSNFFNESGLSSEHIATAILGLNSSCYVRRRSNAFYLGESKITQAVKHLIERYDREYDNDVQRAIIIALGKIGGDEAEKKLNEIVAKHDGMSAESSQQLNKKKKTYGTFVEFIAQK